MKMWSTRTSQLRDTGPTIPVVVDDLPQKELAATRGMYKIFLLPQTDRRILEALRMLEDTRRYPMKNKVEGELLQKEVEPGGQSHYYVCERLGSTRPKKPVPPKRP